MGSNNEYGVLITASPSSGGLYQYSFLMLDALNGALGNNEKIYVICFNEKIFTEINKRYRHRVTALCLARWKLNFHRLLDFLFGESDFGRRISMRISCLSSKMSEFDVDVWLFPNQDNVANFPNGKKIVAVHDLMHRYETRFAEVGGNKLRYLAREKRFRSISRHASCILVDSSTGKSQFYESYGAPVEKILVLPYPAVSLPNLKDTFQVSENLTNLPCANAFFYPAQFWPHKNHINLLLAQKNLLHRGLEVHFIFSGYKSRYYSALSRLVNQLELNHFVHFVGYRSPAELNYLYRSCKALIFPSFLGPTNIPPLEAISVDCPVAVADVYGVKSILGEAAVYFDPNSVASIMEAVCEMNSSNRRGQLVAAGKRIKHKFSPENFNKTFLEHLRTTLGEHSYED